MKKTITINNRELVRSYRLYREKLLNGEVDRVIIPVNGKKLYLAILPEKPTHRPGDIRPLLEKIKLENPYKDLKFIRLSGELTSLKLWKKSDRKNRT
ncbi:hypothetical protein HYW83_03140 [Candidatus Peregrinibacteria bacterium]|nr:hypothetical protein [Candidatus Peregrinibacteria bacterium]